MGTEILESYIAGSWVAGKGNPHMLVNPATEEPLAQTSTEGLDASQALAFARTEAGPALRAMTYRERGELLRAIDEADRKLGDEKTPQH